MGTELFGRLRRPWLNNKIASLLAVVDSYSMELNDLLSKRKQGNVGLTRNVAAINDDDRPHMINLPINFYDADWYRKLDEYEKAELNPRPEMAIPIIVGYFINKHHYRKIASSCIRLRTSGQDIQLKISDGLLVLVLTTLELSMSTPSLNSTFASRALRYQIIFTCTLHYTRNRH